MLGLGVTEIAVIAVVGLIVLGPEKLPETAKSLGKLIGELKRTVDEVKQELLFKEDSDIETHQ